MGEALIRGLIKAGLLAPEQLHVFDVSRSRMEHIETTYAVTSSSSVHEIAGRCTIIILAVKPQNMVSVLHDIGDALSHRPLVISIAAGVPLSLLANHLPEETPLVRVMPNTPALVLEGASALARGRHTSAEQMEHALALFGAVGKALEVEEKWMDAVTGLSGSGPAYILLLLESLIDAGVLMGLPRPIARDLMLQTTLGTVRMLQETGKHPADLKDLITSPAGTTIQGLQVLEERGVRGALFRAVEAAVRRSEELGRH